MMNRGDSGGLVVVEFGLWGREGGGWVGSILLLLVVWYPEAERLWGDGRWLGVLDPNRNGGGKGSYESQSACGVGQ